MPPYGTITRRTVLGTIGTGFIIGTGNAQPDQTDDRQRYETTAENGIVIQFRGCSNIAVRGNVRDTVRVVVSIAYDDDGIPGTDEFIYDVNSPISLDVAAEFPDPEAISPVIATSVTVYSDPGESNILNSASNPNNEECVPQHW